MRAILTGVAVIALLALSACAPTPKPPVDLSPPDTDRGGYTRPVPEVSATAPAAPSEALQREIADVVQSRLGVGSGNGPSPDDPTLIVVSVFAPLFDIAVEDAELMKREVRELAEAEGFLVAFEYGGYDHPAQP